jgi:hypothetical protein
MGGLFADGDEDTRKRRGRLYKGHTNMYINIKKFEKIEKKNRNV